MKKLFCFALLVCLASFLFAGCGKTEEPLIEKTTTAAPEPPLVGGYSEDRPVTDEDKAVFYEALELLDGVAYTPTLVATQVVAGMNYRFTATALGVYPDAQPYQVHIFIFKPLGGAPAELVNIETLTAE